MQIELERKEKIQTIYYCCYMYVRREKEKSNTFKQKKIVDLIRIPTLEENTK
jgi:hypothetical protein